MAAAAPRTPPAALHQGPPRHQTSQPHQRERTGRGIPASFPEQAQRALPGQRLQEHHGGQAAQGAHQLGRLQQPGNWRGEAPHRQRQQHSQAQRDSHTGPGELPTLGMPGEHRDQSAGRGGFNQQAHQLSQRKHHRVQPVPRGAQSPRQVEELRESRRQHHPPGRQLGERLQPELRPVHGTLPAPGRSPAQPPLTTRLRPRQTSGERPSSAAP